MPTVTEATMRVNSFKTLHGVVSSVVPSGWSVLSAFPESNPTFPCVVVSPAKVKISKEGMWIDNRLQKVMHTLEFYAKSSSKKESVDVAMDTVIAGLLTNESTFTSNKLAFATDNPIDQTDVNTAEFGRDKIHFGFVDVSFEFIN